MNLHHDKEKFVEIVVGVISKIIAMLRIKKNKGWYLFWE